MNKVTHEPPTLKARPHPPLVKGAYYANNRGDICIYKRYAPRMVILRDGDCYGDLGDINEPHWVRLYGKITIDLGEPDNEED